MGSRTWLIVLLLCCAAGRCLPPAPPVVKETLVDDLADAAAWVPMTGTAAASVVQIDGRRALKLPCSFAGAEIPRASWDRAVKLDMTMSRGIRFDLYCADPAPVAYFTFYFHAPGGWYAAGFYPDLRAGWQTVTIAKADTRIEDAPAGWGAIDAIRFSAWRGQNTDIELYLANLAVDGATASIAVIRGESAPAGEAQSVTTYTKTVANALDGLGLPYVIVSDLDVTADRLRGKTVAILPHNPNMPDAVANALATYLGNGGKLLAFYTLPPKLANLAGVTIGQHLKQPRPGYFASIRAAEHPLPGQPASVAQASWNIMHAAPVAEKSRVVANWFTDAGEPTNEPAILASKHCVYMTHVLVGDNPEAKRALLIAMLGYLDGGQWQRAAEVSLRRAGTLGRYTSYDEATAGIRALAQGNPQALAALAEADTGYREAVAAAGENRFLAAMQAAVQTRAALLQALCLAQQPLAGEHRAWWCHDAFGVAGMTWDEAIKGLADNGFTAILPNMLWGGAAFYDSTVLPVAPEVAAQGDQLAACLAACKKYGVQCHVWKVNWYMSTRAPEEFTAKMRQDGRTQVAYDGTPEPLWLCPSHPLNQQLEIDAMIEAATKYDVDGVHFDYIRYPDADHCFCAGCRARFEAVLGKPIANWPADTRTDPAIRPAWFAFRRDNITRVVAAVHDAVKQVKPNVKISAAVFPNYAADRDAVGQDWQLWCERGYLDFVCPMTYTSSDAQFETLIGWQVQWAGKVPCYPGIGLSVWPELDAPKLIEQITLTRRAGTGGFTIFNYGGPEAAGIVPRCGQGITRKE
ncbi:MAG: glycoside hydrolase family 10 protein [Armatimonadota bacterium]